MTIDDVDKSVYVGGLPYDITEASLRKTFSFYGHVIAVKINNEGVGGKCYGFVTFTNPRSAIDAIKDMNGGTIGGRVVRVNDVKAKSGRPNTTREGFRRNFDRSLSDRGRDRDREYVHYEDRSLARKRDLTRGQGRDRARGIVRENNHNHNNRVRDRSTDLNRERSLGRTTEEEEEEEEEEDDRKREQEWERDHDSDHYPKQVISRNGNDDDDQELRQLNRSRFGDQRSREQSSESKDNDYEVEEELKDANQQVEELHKQVSQMEELLNEKQQKVSQLQAESQKLENALTAAKKLSSQRQMLLVKLSRYFLRVKSYKEKLKSTEHELESLVDTNMVEVDNGDDLRSEDDVLAYNRF